MEAAPNRGDSVHKLLQSSKLESPAARLQREEKQQEAIVEKAKDSGGGGRREQKNVGGWCLSQSGSAPCVLGFQAEAQIPKWQCGFVGCGA